MPDTYFVSGAAGHLGRAVVNHLINTFEVAPANIIAGTRDASKVADLTAKGVQVRASDFDDEAGLAKSLAGVSHFLMISTDAMAPGQRLAQHMRAVKAAETAGVKLIVYTSIPKAETCVVSFAPDHLGTEKAIAASKIPNQIILRNNWYFENLFHSMPHALKSGMQYTAAGNGKTAHIWRDDLARAAAAALASGKVGKATYTLSGSKGYTAAEIAALVSKATGKPIKVVDVPVAGLIQGMIGAGIPEPVAKTYASFDVNIAQGGLDGDGKDYKSLIGEEPHGFEEWLAVNAKAIAAA